MSKEAIEHYEAALKEAFPSGATGDVFHHWNEARKALAEQPAQDNTYGYAKYLAEAMFKRHFASDEHYASGRVVWGVNDTVIGILTQIDNMVADMVRRPAQQEPVAWVYSEGLEALKNGKPWTAYGTKQEANNIALYLHPTPECEPYAWVTFTPYGDEDDVWYENPEGQLLEGWTYKPLYDTAPPRREWVELTDDEIDVMANDFEEGYVFLYRSFTRAIEAKLREKNT